MKLSELIAFRNRLDELTVDEAQVAAKQKLDRLMHLVEEPTNTPLEPLVDSFLPELKNKYDSISNAFSDFDQHISLVKKRVKEQIAEQEKQFFQLSYQLFEEAELCETTEGILYGRQPGGGKNSETILSEEILCSRLSNYANWQVSGMIIRPGLENFINKMVGCDPLYIIDRNHDLLTPCLKKFPKLYQNRLRPYYTNDWSDEPILGKIPNNQFGLCLAYKVFDYRPLEIIRRYLEEIYQKLLPGGALLMTFNDCDNPKGVMLVEQYCASYTPGYLVRDLAESIGYQIIHSWSDGGPSGWLELRKEGKFESLRGGQTLAFVHRIDGYLDDVDYLRRKVYTQKEILDLHESAKNFGISEESIINLHPYELQLLINEKVREVYRAERLEEEKRQIKKLKSLCKELNINYDDPERDELIRIAQLKPIALENNIDITRPDWEDQLERLMREREKEQRRREKEQQKIAEQERKIAAEKEKQRILELHDRARNLGIDPTSFDSEATLVNTMAEIVDKRKKEELAFLRKRALELEAGDPNLIRYGYSAEKLKHLIKQKEENK